MSDEKIQAELERRLSEAERQFSLDSVARVRGGLIADRDSLIASMQKIPALKKSVRDIGLLIDQLGHIE